MDRSVAPMGDRTPSEKLPFRRELSVNPRISREQAAMSCRTSHTEHRRSERCRCRGAIFCFRRAVEDDRMVGFRRKRGSARFTGSFPSFYCNFRVFSAPSATKRRRAPPSAAFSATYAAARRENIAIRHSGRERTLQTRRISSFTSCSRHC